MEELISVVIPTHNRADLLPRAVESAMKQTYKNIEINVVSDGSEDTTDDVMKGLCEKDSRIHFFSYHPGKGGNYARNFGIKKSNGVYVAFLDDDDEWYEEKLAKQLELFNADKQIGIVCTAMNSVHPKENYYVPFVPQPEYDSSHLILLKNCIGSTTTVMVKKELFDVVGMFDENLGALQDYDMWVRLCQVAKVGVVQVPCVDYNNYDNSNQISKYTDKYEKAVAYLDEKYQKEISELSEADQRKRKVYFLLLLSKKAMRNGAPKKSREYALKAWKIEKSKAVIMCYGASFFSNDFTNKVTGVIRKLSK